MSLFTVKYFQDTFNNILTFIQAGIFCNTHIYFCFVSN